MLGPYLDSELDTKTTHDIEQHLQLCPDCARVFDAETKLEVRIVATLREGARTASLWRELESQIAPASPWGWLWQRPLWAAGAVATAAVVVGLAVTLWPREQPLEMAAALEKCHHKYAARITAPEFSGAPPPEIVAKMGNELDVAAFQYRPAKAGFLSPGARFCYLSTVPVAYILGEYQGVPVSLVVFKKSLLSRFPQTKQKLESGEPVVCGQAGRYRFAARLVNDCVVCVMGDAAKTALEELVGSVSKPT
ncbi:MAG: zf-HC2 domain-containing protein [Verrucomicrobia bacterium]|nr:zf-HC2 domain-containing protein [Verrucomicrobiota bacterium]